jgi:hypothetical protein
MLKLFIAAISVGLIYWLWLKKKQIFSSRNNKIDPFITTIEAIEIQNIGYSPFYFAPNCT